jgi:hypothetical protein
MGENLSQLIIWQEIINQNIKKIKKTKLQKNQ